MAAAASGVGVRGGVADQPAGVLVVDGHEAAARVVGEGRGADAAGDVVQRGERPPAVLAAPGVPLDAARVDVVRPQLGGDGLAEGAGAGLGRAASYGRELGTLGDVGALGHHGRGERHDLLHRRPGCVRHRLG